MNDHNEFAGGPGTLPGVAGTPLSPLEADDAAGVKLAHDRYHVFVNGDFVGNKTMVTQGENIRDVERFLRSRGFDRFKAHVEGDRMWIEMDEDRAEDAKRHLATYLQLR